MGWTVLLLSSFAPHAYASDFSLPPSDQRNQKAPNANITSPILKATLYGIQPGKINQSESSQRWVCWRGMILSFDTPNLSPGSQISRGIFGNKRWIVSGLIGIHPPFRVITARFSINPRPIKINPGWRMFTTANMSRRICDPISATGIHASGKLLLV